LPGLAIERPPVHLHFHRLGLAANVRRYGNSVRRWFIPCRC
jgi:hypothetical protein